MVATDDDLGSFTDRDGAARSREPVNVDVEIRNLRELPLNCMLTTSRVFCVGPQASGQLSHREEQQLRGCFVEPAHNAGVHTVAIRGEKNLAVACVGT